MTNETISDIEEQLRLAIEMAEGDIDQYKEQGNEEDLLYAQRRLWNLSKSLSLIKECYKEN